MNSSKLMNSLSGQQTAAVNNNAGAQTAFNQTANQGAPLNRINTLGMPQQKPKEQTVYFPSGRKALELNVDISTLLKGKEGDVVATEGMEFIASIRDCSPYIKGHEFGNNGFPKFFGDSPEQMAEAERLGFTNNGQVNFAMGTIRHQYKLVVKMPEGANQADYPYIIGGESHGVWTYRTESEEQSKNLFEYHASLDEVKDDPDAQLCIGKTFRFTVAKQAPVGNQKQPRCFLQASGGYDEIPTPQAVLEWMAADGCGNVLPLLQEAA